MKNEKIPYDCFTVKDLDFWGKWKNELVHKFVNAKFDYLLVLNIHRNTYVRNLVAMSKSKCRVGLYQKESEPHFELMFHLNGEANLDNLIQQIDNNLKNV